MKREDWCKTEHHCIYCGRVVKGPAISLHTKHCKSRDNYDLIHLIRTKSPDTPAPLTGGV